MYGEKGGANVGVATEDIENDYQMTMSCRNEK